MAIRTETPNAVRTYRPGPAGELVRVAGHVARTVAIGLAFGLGLVAAGYVTGYIVAPAIFAAFAALGFA